MSFVYVALFFVVLAAVSLLLDQPWAKRSFVATRLGLDVKGLVALLPPELQAADYQGFREHLFNDRVYVGLILRGRRDSKTPLPPGNPANVGLEFDAATTKLIAVHPEGLPLGIK